MNSINIMELHNDMFHLVGEAWNEQRISDDHFLAISAVLGGVWAIATGELVGNGENLPQHAENVSHETYSPESRNRSEDTQPTTMGNTNNKENNMNITEALEALVTHITQQVTEAMEAVIETAIEDALSDYNPTEHMDFEDMVREAVSGMTVTATLEA